MKKIFHVVERLDIEYGGPAYSVPHLAKNLNSKEFNNIVVGGSKGDLDNKILLDLGVEYFVKKSLIVKLGIVPLIYPKLFAKYGQPDFMFFHNLWNGITLFGFLYCLLLRIPFAVTPRGSLFKWSLHQGTLRKRIAWWVFQKKMLEKSDFVHVTSYQEADAVKELVDVETVISPNGISMAPQSGSKIEHLIEKKLQHKKIIFLGRLHKKKNIEALIEAYSASQIQNKFFLEIVGNSETVEYLNSLKQLAIEKKMSKRILFSGFVSGLAKEKLLETSALLILPSFTENFGVVVLEALSFGTPVVASVGTPWRELEEVGAGYWVDCEENPEVLVETLDKFSELSEEFFSQMCKNSIILARNYRWENCVVSLKQRLARGSYRDKQIKPRN